MTWLEWLVVDKPRPELGVCGVCFDVLHPRCSRMDWVRSDLPLTREEWELVRRSAGR